MMGGEKFRAGQKQLMIQSTTSCVKHGGGSVMEWACMAAKGTGSLVFMDDVTPDRSICMNSEA